MLGPCWCQIPAHLDLPPHFGGLAVLEPMEIAQLLAGVGFDPSPGSSKTMSSEELELSEMSVKKTVTFVTTLQYHAYSKCCIYLFAELK
jgi:hypothetical protein